MIFNSLLYALFLPVVYLVFYFTSDRFRWLVLLAASYGFYAALKAPQLLLVLGLVTLISYDFGIRLKKTNDKGKRKMQFWMATVGCLLVLALMKYLLPLLSSKPYFPYPSLLVSIGVSYFTFQSISYLVDVYLEVQEPEQHFGYHALALSFFPKLLQGPIERAGFLLPQLKKEYRFDYDQVRSGLLLFVLGLFKKVVLADRLALFANAAYNDVHAYAGLPLIIATYAYVFQLYFDFSGYTDMAVGTARIFGINLTENFNSPYLATSIADFWRRWHISFSRWILDYIFRPLQMAWRDYRQAGTALALIVTFVISGIWHGASWGFVAWGLLHGIYLAASTYYRPYQKKLHKFLRVEKKKWFKVWQVFVTFHLVTLAFIFFRANTISDACYVVTHLFTGSISFVRAMVSAVGGLQIANINGLLRPLLLNQPRSEFMIAIFILVIIGIIALIKDQIRLFQRPVWVRWAVYYLLFITISFYGSFNIKTQFVYFQF